MTADPVTEFERYREQLLAALGDDKPVAVLRSTLDELSSLLEDKSAEHLKRRPVPGEWGARQVLNHLADTDLVYGVRVRMMVTQERPMIVGYDQDAWNDRFGDLDAAPWETLERWKALRRANLRVYESLTPAECQRVGLHTERGEESVELNLRLLAGHDRIHLVQLRRALAM